MTRRTTLKAILGSALALFMSGENRAENNGLMIGNISDELELSSADRLLDSNHENKGKLVRCYLEGRDSNEFMFMCQSDGTIVANLEGYAIIPIEKWESLTGRKFEC